MPFYIAIIAFIISVVAGVISMIIGKNVSKEKFKIFAIIHGLFFFIFLASLFLNKETETFNFFFLFFICSGVILSGIVWKSGSAKLLKYYFSIYVITIGMFILSPSRLANFLLTSKYVDTLGETFNVMENYFLERQNSSMHENDTPLYKLIRKRGIFHSSLQRDIDFGGKLDSIKVLDFDKSEKGLIRGYTSSTTYVSTKLDSADVEIILKKKTIDGLEYKL